MKNFFINNWIYILFKSTRRQKKKLNVTNKEIEECEYKDRWTRKSYCKLKTSKKEWYHFLCLAYRFESIKAPIHFQTIWKNFRHFKVWSSSIDCRRVWQTSLFFKCREVQNYNPHLFVYLCVDKEVIIKIYFEEIKYKLKIILFYQIKK